MQIEASFTYWLHGFGWPAGQTDFERPPAVVCHGGPHADYIRTSACVLSSALTLLEDADRLPSTFVIFAATLWPTLLFCFLYLEAAFTRLRPHSSVQTSTSVCTILALNLSSTSPKRQVTREHFSCNRNYLLSILFCFIIFVSELSLQKIKVDC